MQNINPVYKSINKIDFTSYNELCDILYLDKHTRIEGLCSEAVFMEDVIQDNLHPVATGFWFTRMAKDQPGFHIRKVITDISVPLNNLDYRILDEFASIPSTPVSIVYFTEDSKSFLEFTHTKGERYDNIKDMGITIQPNDNAVIAEEKYRNKERIEKACEFLDHRGLLKNAAISRLFANRWLGRAVWDIDAFTLSSSGQIIALEVKQKYPTNNNKFGLNDGQEKLFRFLNEAEIPVIHIILLKPERDLSIHAVDLLTLPEYTQRTNWIFTRYFPEKLKSAATFAPEYTSIFGQSKVPYKEIPVNQFAFLKNLGKSSKDVRAKLLAGLD